MPIEVTDPFGNAFQTCSISTSVKAKFDKNFYNSEAAWAKAVKNDAWNVLRQKINNGELKKNTILARAPGSMKLKLTQNDGGAWRVQTLQGTKVVDEIGTLAFDMTSAFKNHDWDFGPNMAKLAQAEKLVVNSPAKLADWLDKHDNEIEIGDSIATVTPKGGSKMNVTYEGFDGDKPQFKMNNSWGTEIMDLDGLGYYHKSDGYDVAYKVGQTPDVPPAAGLPVASTSKSVGALTNEDAATMFVKTKDQLAKEAGLNIQAAGKIDDLVYKTIADQAGYTPTEMKAKIQAYKDSGKKLSSLKKKVLPKTGDATKAPTQKAVDNATAAVKKEEILPEEVPQVWDEEAVAKAYIKAKDHVVATNDKGWTLYTKNDDFDAAIHKWMQADLGPIKKDVADTAIANYIANHKKLSVLKKQMIKNNELTPQADTLKGPKASKVNSPADVKAEVIKNDEAYFDTTVAVLTDGTGLKYEVVYKGIDVNDLPVYSFKYPSGTKQKMTHTEFEDVSKSGSYTVEYTLKPTKIAPKETGAGQTGKVTEDPKKVAAELPQQQKQDIFDDWESSNLPLSSSGASLHQKAQGLAQMYGLGDDVLPVLRALDEFKAKKFGATNGHLYEKKVVEYLKNPNPPGYSTNWASGSSNASKSHGAAAGTWGELPEDSILFQAISVAEMNMMATTKMPKFSATSKSALHDYTGSYYGSINNHLRQGGAMTSKGQLIRDAMAPLPENIVVRRGTSLKGLGMSSPDELAGSVGKTFVENGFSSTAVGGSGQFSGAVNLIIQAPKGTKAAWLKPISSYSNENELLLDSGMKFEILKVEVKSTGYGTTNVVTVRVVPE